MTGGRRKKSCSKAYVTCRQAGDKIQAITNENKSSVLNRCLITCRFVFSMSLLSNKRRLKTSTPAMFFPFTFLRAKTLSCHSPLVAFHIPHRCPNNSLECLGVWGVEELLSSAQIRLVAKIRSMREAQIFFSVVRPRPEQAGLHYCSLGHNYNGEAKEWGCVLCFTLSRPAQLTWGVKSKEWFVLEADNLAGSLTYHISCVQPPFWAPCSFFFSQYNSRCEHFWKCATCPSIGLQLELQLKKNFPKAWRLSHVVKSTKRPDMFCFCCL